MKRSAILLLGSLLLVACAGSTRSQADQDRDGKVLADAMRAAYTEGGGFKLDQQLQLTGGDIPSGKAVRIHTVVGDGSLKGGSAKFAYRLEQGQQAATYDMLVADNRLYVRQHGGSTWKTAPLPAVTTLFPALRLELLRETVLLASSISTGMVTHVDAGFARKYVITPARDQLEQLESMEFQGQEEEQFLKTARAEVDVFLLFPGNKLARVEVRMSGTEPSSGTKQEVESALDLRSAKVGAIQAPAGATPVSPADLLS